MLRLDDVFKTYKVGAFGGSELVAVRGVSFDVRPGEVVSLIGESGSGKSTIGKMILRLSSITSGSITFDGADISRFGKRQLRSYYGKVQGVFQDPFSSFNPVFKVEHIFGLLREGYFSGTSDSEWRSRVAAALEGVNLDPAQCLHKYPHQLSGGQLQRLLVARALILDIRVLVADEIISMLDASTRIDVLNLLADLRERQLGVLFITHDLSLGHYISDRTVILHRGCAVELGPTEAVFARPAHEYTKQLLASVPRVHTKWSDDRIAVPEIPSDGNEPPPRLVEIAPGHLVADRSA